MNGASSNKEKKKLESADNQKNKLKLNKVKQERDDD